MADPANTSPADTSPADTSPADNAFTFESAASKTYPLCPEGIQRVIVDKALFEMRDNFQKTAKVPTISLWLSTLDAKYKDETSGEDRSYRLFKTMKVSDHEKSTMHEFFQRVMGTPVPLRETAAADGTVAKRIYIGPRTVETVEDGEDKVHYPAFENLEFIITVAHKKLDDGRTKDGVDSVVACNPEQKGLNAKLFATE